LVWDGRTKDFGLNNSKHSLNLIYSWFHHECHSDVSVVPKYLNFATFSNDALAILIFWFCPEFGWRDIIIYFVFSAFIYITPLTASKRISAFSFMVFILSHKELTSSAQTNSRCVPLNWFSWSFLMAYSEAKFKNNGDKASHCFRSFLIGNVSDKSLPARTLLQVSLKHILVSLTSFLGTPSLSTVPRQTFNVCVCVPSVI
jgi:hypothetical protein